MISNNFGGKVTGEHEAIVAQPHDYMLKNGKGRTKLEIETAEPDAHIERSKLSSRHSKYAISGTG